MLLWLAMRTRYNLYGSSVGHWADFDTVNKAPPQLWRIEFVKDRTNEANVTARLSLHQTYMPKMPVDFAGPSYFGGSNDQLVLCAGKGKCNSTLILEPFL